jgi:hypothetical protein
MVVILTLLAKKVIEAQKGKTIRISPGFKKNVQYHIKRLKQNF